MRARLPERSAFHLPPIVGGLLALALTAQAEDIDLEWIDREALEAGAILVETDRNGPGEPVDIRAAVLIDATVDAVWDVLTECERAPEYVPTIVSCELLETLEDGRAQLFEQTVRSVFFLPRFRHVFRLDYDPPRRIDVHRVSGRLAHLEGTWRLLPSPGGEVLLAHELAVDPGAPVPRFMVRARLRRDVEQTLEAVRERAEAAARQPLR